MANGVPQLGVSPGLPQYPQQQRTASQDANAAGLMNLGGSLLTGLQNGISSSNNAAISREQSYLNAAQNADQLQLQRNAQQLQAQQLANQVSQQDPLAAQKARQQAALFAAILPGLRNASVTPGAGLSRYTPQVSGGFRIPEGGFDADTLSMFSPSARANAEQQFYRQNAATLRAPDLDKVGYDMNGPNGQSVGFDLNHSNQDIYDGRQADLLDQQRQADARRQALMAALQQAQGQAQKAAKGPSTASKILGGLGAAAGTIGSFFV